MQTLNLNGLHLYQFPGLARLPGLRHAVSTRDGAGAAMGGLDLGNSGPERPADAAANLERLRLALGLERLVYNRQVHGTDILAVNGAEPGPPAAADGLATDRPGLGLLIRQADCQALILAAPRRGVIANLHVGWRGNAAGLPGKGVAFLQERYDAAPSELYAAISPGLGACCGQFVNWRRELPEWFAQFRVGEDRFDLEAATRAQLMAAGVRPERIEASGLCTVCRPEFYSHRREGGTGRFGTVVALVN
ncbi:MAG: laccase domain-containing protein [Desulfarculus sp.]|nr:MAG: laccase domain-containing protein [Desulfarculus sp.]